MDAMRRVLYGHQWSDLVDWVHALDELAGLNDDEIERLVTPSAPEPEPHENSSGKKRGPC